MATRLARSLPALVVLSLLACGEAATTSPASGGAGGSGAGGSGAGGAGAGGIGGTGGGQAQPPLLVTFDIHPDPMPQNLPVEQRREMYRRWLSNLTWLLDTAEPHGARLSFLSAGEFLEFCLEDPEAETSCFPVLRRLHASGGLFGTHTHTEIRAGSHDWPELHGTVSDADLARNWDDTKALVDEAIRVALGVEDPARIAAINTARGSHLPDTHGEAAAMHTMLVAYGFTILEGGPDQELVPLFGHVPFNVFRPGACGVCEELGAGLVTVPQSTVIGQVGEHFGVQQDGSAPRKQVEILQALANRRSREARGEGPKIWAYGWGVHPSDLDPGSPGRAAIEELLPWIRDEHAAGGAARFASYLDARDAYLAWEQEHPGESSFDFSAATADYDAYPYLEWANRFLRNAKLEARLGEAGSGVYSLRAGELPLALILGGDAPATLDLSASLGAGTVRKVDLASGVATEVDAASVASGAEPSAVCRPADCDAILALEQPAGACGTGPACAAGQVCASDAGLCVPDCRAAGFSCPAARPACDLASGVCRP